MSFKKLTTNCLRKLRPLLHSQLPFTAHILNIVDLQLKGKVITKTLQTDIYGIPDTEIINVTWTPLKSPKKSSVTNLIHLPPLISHLKLEMSEISQAYQELIDFDRPLIFEIVPSTFVPHLEEIFEEKGGTIQTKLEIAFLYCPEDVVRKLDTKKWADRVRDQFEIDNLSPEHMEKVNSYWHFGNKETGASVLREIQETYQCGKGIFRKGHPKNSENLVSWGLFVPLGTLASLHTMEEYRGKGLARWTLEECIKSMATDLGLVPCCEVLHENVASLSLTEKIGMKLVGDVCYFEYLPPNLK